MTNPFAWADPVQPDGRQWESIHSMQADAERPAREAALAAQLAASAAQLSSAEVPAERPAPPSASRRTQQGEQVSPPANESKED